MIGLSVAVSTVFLRDKLYGLTAGVTVVSLLGGFQSNLWVSIDLAHQYPRNQFAGNRTWVRIPPSPPKPAAGACCRLFYVPSEAVSVSLVKIPFIAFADSSCAL